MVNDIVAPVDIKAEQGTIGGVLNNPLMMNKIGYLDSKHFSLKTHRDIWGLIKKIDRADTLLLLSAMKANGVEIKQDGYEGGNYLEYCQTLAVNGLTVPKFAKSVYMCYAGRYAIKKFQDAIEICNGINPSTSSGDFFEKIDEMSFDIAKLSTPLNENGGPRWIEDVIKDEIIPEVELRRSGDFKLLSTGVEIIDNSLGGGLQGGRVYLIGAYSGVGKTECALSFASHTMTQGKVPLIFSMEMARQEVSQRLIQMNNELSVFPFISPQNMMEKEYQEFLEELKSFKYKVIIDDTEEVTPLYIRNKVREYVLQGVDIGLVMVDYAALQKAGTDVNLQRNEYARLHYIHAQNKLSSRKLKDELNVDIPFLVLEQFTKDSLNGEPNLSHYQFQVGRHADVCFALKRTSDSNEGYVGVGHVDVWKVKDRQTGMGVGKSYQVYRNPKSGIYKDLVMPT